MTVKVILLAVTSILAGLILLVTGFYFMSERFIRKLDESTGELSEENNRKNKFRAKGSGMTSMALGAVTLLWGIFILAFPAIISALALIYMILLILAFAVIYFVFK